jgi:hypothetical protein
MPALVLSRIHDLFRGERERLGWGQGIVRRRQERPGDSLREQVADQDSAPPSKLVGPALVPDALG